MERRFPMRYRIVTSHLRRCLVLTPRLPLAKRMEPERHRYKIWPDNHWLKYKCSCCLGENYCLSISPSPPDRACFLFSFCTLNSINIPFTAPYISDVLGPVNQTTKVRFRMVAVYFRMCCVFPNVLLWSHALLLRQRVLQQPSDKKKKKKQRGKQSKHEYEKIRILRESRYWMPPKNTRTQMCGHIRRKNYKT